MDRSWLGIGKARIGAICALVLACACFPLATAQTSDSAPATKASSSTPQKSSASSAGSTTSSSTRKRSRKKKSSRLRGQQKIDSERATAIQAALIREHYLSGEATGKWNDASEQAMRRYQADHGWQSKVVPDSRALIKLGLGPSKDHLLNPESAMTTGPDAPRTSSQTAPADPPASPSHPQDTSSPQ